MSYDAGLTELPLRAVIELRGTRAHVAAALSAAGLPVPDRPNSWRGDRGQVLWIGPDNWWLVAPIDDEEILLSTLNRALGGTGSAVVLSDSLLGFRLEGSEASDILAQGTAIDLAAFGPADCTRTSLTKVWMVLRRADRGFEILVDRAYGSYVRGWVAAARG
jgi:sarcosine oxidase subunit gamma